MRTSQIKLGPADWVPNNTVLPVLVYRQAVEAGDMPAAFERLFSQNGWEGIWHDGIFDYHHYHSGAHEALGIAGGSAKLMIGGPGGQEIDVSSGDCLVLPAGTGHMNLGCTGDFHVVGAYPPGQHADILTSAPSRTQQDRMDNLPVPKTDPIQGSPGFLSTVWRS